MSPSPTVHSVTGMRCFYQSRVEMVIIGKIVKSMKATVNHDDLNVKSRQQEHVQLVFGKFQSLNSYLKIETN